MSISSRSSRGDVPENLPSESNDLDRLFGREFSHNGWVIDLARLQSSVGEDQDIQPLNEDDLDPVMIWVMNGRRR